MMEEKDINIIETLIGKDDLTLAAKMLLELVSCKECPQELRQDVILIQRRLSEIERARLRRSLPFEEISRLRGQLAEDILAITNMTTRCRL